MNEKLIDQIIGNVFINMWGYANRNNGIIEIRELDLNKNDDFICLTIANMASSLYGCKIKVNMNLFQYLKYLKENKIKLFNKTYIWSPFKKGYLPHKWLYDVSEACGQDKNFWSEVYNYLKEDGINESNNTETNEK